MLFYEAETNHFYFRYFNEISCVKFCKLMNHLKIKQNYYQDFVMSHLESYQSLLLDLLGICRKLAKVIRLPKFWFFFSRDFFICEKKNHQMVKFKKIVEFRFGPGNISKLIFFKTKSPLI